MGDGYHVTRPLAKLWGSDSETATLLEPRCTQSQPEARHRPLDSIALVLRAQHPSILSLILHLLPDSRLRAELWCCLPAMNT